MNDFGKSHVPVFVPSTRAVTITGKIRRVSLFRGINFWNSFVALEYLGNKQFTGPVLDMSIMAC